MTRVLAIVIATFMLMSSVHANEDNFFFSERSGFWLVAGMTSEDHSRSCNAITRMPKLNTTVMLSQDLDAPREFTIEADVSWWNVPDNDKFTILYANKDNELNTVETGQFIKRGDKYIQIRNVNAKNLILNFSKFETWTIALENGDKVVLDLKGASKMIDVLIKCIQSSTTGQE